jgi:hypothetical protein
MRLVIAIVLLLIQLRPLAGAVVCLEQTMSSQECAMPEHGGAVTEPSESGQSMPASCQTAALCSPAGVAVPQTATPVAVVQMPVAAEEGPESARLSGPPVAPPFHPPRV